MKVTGFKQVGDWQDVRMAAGVTIEKHLKDPTQKWLTEMIRSEHSPIRLVSFVWVWEDLPSYVSTHMVRHKHGIEHFVRTQREDRTGVKREDRKQTDPVEHMCQANVQAIINISRKRLCRMADTNTIKAWKIVVDKMPDVVKTNCVSECVYRGYCPEIKSCGYVDSMDYQEKLHQYRGL